MGSILITLLFCWGAVGWLLRWELAHRMAKAHRVIIQMLAEKKAEEEDDHEPAY